MAQKRGRQSASTIGASSGDGVGSADKDNKEHKSSVMLQFEDFRRRHIKQNKDVIKHHVLVKMAMSAVQEEANVLRAEILAVRAKNTALIRELREWESGSRSHGGDRAGLPDQASRKAIEAILAAVPALQHLLDRSHAKSGSQHPIPPLSTPEPPASCLTQFVQHTGPVVCAMPAVETVRLAANAAKVRELGTLVEGSECGSEADPADLEERRQRTKRKARTSQLASRATRTVSPPPQIGLHDPILSPTGGVRDLSISSPSASPPVEASPRPKARSEKSKKRRQSGLISPFIVPNAPAESPVHDSGFVPGSTEPPSGGREETTPADAEQVRPPSLEQEDEEAVLDLIAHDDKADPGSAKEGVAISEQEQAGTKAAEQHTATMVIDADQEVPTAASIEGDGEGGGGGRVRRSRNSVMSYKEPSLNKKMRKPDGTTVEDALKGRASLAAAPGSLYSSTSAPPSEHGSDPSLPVASVGTADAGVPSQKSRSARNETISAALRRKSMYPRAGRNAVKGRLGNGSESASDSELSSIGNDSNNDDDDDFIVPRPLPSLPLSADINGHSVSGTTSRTAYDPISISSTSDPASRPSSNSVRSSPRKSPVKKPNYVRPSSSSLAKKAPSGGLASLASSRDPLVDRADNAQAVAGGSSRRASGLSGTVMKGPLAGSGRATLAIKGTGGAGEVPRKHFGHSGKIQAV